MAKKTCTVDGCAGAVVARGLCNRHYTRQFRGRPLDDSMIRRKLPNVSLDTVADCVTVDARGCWNWAGTKNANGYGVVQSGGRQMQAHRWHYTEVNGPLSARQYVCHKCDNPACINLDHLYVGTPEDNMRDMVMRDRCAHARLAASDARAVIKLIASGFGVASIAAIFGVSEAAIYNIKAGRTWRCLQLPSVAPFVAEVRG